MASILGLFRSDLDKEVSPELWNIFGMKRDIVSRTNNPLERYHREINPHIRGDHPSLDRFVPIMEKLARLYVNARRSSIALEASPPERPKMTFPRAPVLPNRADIKDSETESEDGSSGSSVATACAQSDCDLNVSDSSETQLYDDDQGPPQYDISFDYDGEEKSEAIV